MENSTHAFTFEAKAARWLNSERASYLINGMPSTCWHPQDHTKNDHLEIFIYKYICILCFLNVTPILEWENKNIKWIAQHCGRQAGNEAGYDHGSHWNASFYI